MAFISLQSRNFSDRVIRHQNFLGELDRLIDIDDQHKADATFDIQELEGNLVRFSAINFASFVLRHQDFRIKLSELRFDLSDPSTSPPETAEHRQTREDSTFARVTGLGNNVGIQTPNGVSFQATNVPGGPFFIRHRDFHLFLDPFVPFPDPEGEFDLGYKEEYDLALNFSLDATFFIVGPLVPEQFPPVG